MLNATKARNLAQYARVGGKILLPIVFACLTGCNAGSGGVDKFLGSDAGAIAPTFALSFLPASYDFGPVITTTVTPLKHLITVVNSTPETYFVTNVGGSGSSDFTVQNETCTIAATGIAPNQTCTFVVSFLPSSGGLRSFAVALKYGTFIGATSKTATFNVTGTGALPATLSISDAPVYGFGNVVQGGSKNKTLTVTNGGNIEASAMVGVAPGAPFSFVGGTYPGLGGTCGSTLLGGASCSIAVTFAPTSLGAASGTVSLSYYNGDQTTTTSRGLSGTGATPASLNITDSPAYAFGTVAVGGGAAHVFTISNTGGVEATALAVNGLSAPFGFTGGSFPGAGGTCVDRLASGASCTISITFGPTVTGAASSSWTVAYDDGLITQNLPMTTTGNAVTPASLSISNGPTYDFGTKIVGSITDVTLTVTNGGGFTASGVGAGAMSAPFTYKGGAFPGTGGTCSASLAPAANCTVVVTFAPSAGGTFSGQVAIGYASGAANQTATRALQGIAVTAANLAISDGPTYNYGTWPTGVSRDKTFTITNSGGFGAASVVGSVSGSGYAFKGGAYPGTGGTCATTLNPSATCTVIVTFAPGATGTLTGTLDFSYADGLATANSSRALTANAVTPAALAISDGPTFDFGVRPIGGVAEKTLTLANTGGFAASVVVGTGVSAPFGFKGGAYPGTSGTCAATLAAGATCTFVVTYSPIAAVTSTGTVTVTYDNGVSAQSTVRGLSGTGVQPATLAISDDPIYDFGTVATGATVDKTLTVTNTGSYRAASLSGGGLGAPFTFRGGTFPGTGGTCGSTLTSGSSCSIVVRFAPVATGPFAANATLTYDDGVTTQTSTRAVQGVGTTPALLTISDGPTYTFATIAYGATSTKTLTVNNAGGVTASSLTAGTLSAPFSFAGGSGYPGAGGTCGAALASSANCTVVVEFNPTAAGSFAGTLQLNYSDSVNNVSSARALAGQAVAPAQLDLGGATTYDFGTVAVGGSADATITVGNTGAFAATAIGGTGLIAPFTFKGGSYPGAGGSCGATLNPGASCTLAITYQPTSSGTQTGTLTLGFNNGVTTQNVSRGVRGQGAAPASLAISDGPNFDYGSLAIGGIAQKTFTVTNGGGVTATAISGGGISAPFTFKGGAYPGTAGTCGTQLNAGASCVIVVQFAPTATGTATGSISLAYSDGAGNQSSARAVQGTGVPPASLAFSDGPIFDFGSVPQGGALDKAFTITNSGSLTATTLAGGTLMAPFRYKGGAYPGTGGNCAASLAPGASCLVVLQFAPTSTGSFNDTASIAYYDGAANQTASRSIQGTGALPGAITISDGPTYNFGTLPNGGSAQKIFTITNSGGYAVSSLTGAALTAPYTYVGGSYPGAGGSCAGGLAAGASCTIAIGYAPTGTGTTNATLTLNYNDGVNPQSSVRGLQGTAVPPANLAISDGPSYDFGTIAVGGTSDKIFTVTNTGGVLATSVAGGTVTAPFTFKGGGFPGSGGNCTATLNVGASCTIVVTYAPSVTGLQTGSVGIAYNDGVNPQTATTGVQGTGATPALITLSDGPSYDFGTLPLGATADKTFTLNNSGGVSAVGLSGSGLSAPFTFKGGSYPGTGGTCTSALAASATCTVVVTFAPSSIGTPTGTLTIGYNNQVSAQSASRTIQGTAVAPAQITISDGPTYDFGTQANGSVTDRTFTLINGGGYPSNSMAGAGLGGPFSYKGGSYPGTGGTCATNLTNGNSCTIVVSFQPTATGSYTNGISITYGNGATGQTATRGVQGAGAPPANLVISDATTYNFGLRATTSSTDHTFTITNSGGVPATSILPGALSAPFSYKGGSYPGGGNCATGLAAGASCTVIVTYAPTTTGAHSGTLQLNYGDGTGSASATRGMSGTGAAPASITISDGATYDFGTIASGGTLDKTLTLTNGGGVPAASVSGSVTGTGYAFKGGTFPGTGGTCTATLNQSGSCTIVVTFAPTTNGVKSGSIGVTYDDGVSAQSAARALTGTAVAPALLAISDGPTYDFGTYPVGSTAEKVLTVTNSGAFNASTLASVALSAPFAYKGGTYPGVGGNCATSLAASGTCTIVVTFSPAANGPSSGSASITYNDGAQAQTSTRALQGTGAPVANLVISGVNPYDFGSVPNGAAIDRTLTVTNSGGVGASALTGGGVAAPFTFKDGSYPGTGGTCTTTLAATASCTVVVNFRPTTLGAQSGSLQISYNNGLNVQTTTRPLTGLSVNPALLTISDGPTYDFGTRATGSNNERTLTVTNGGDVSATALAGSGLSAPFAFKGGAYPGTGGTCTTSLNASLACTIVVTYLPAATGTQSNTIAIAYNDGVQAQSATRGVQGTGAAPAALSISDATTYDFGTIAVGSTVEKVFTVQNSGGVAATALAGSGLTGSFAFKGGTFPGTGGTCTTSLNASGNCTIVATYHPTATGTHSATMSLAYNDGVTAQSATRPVTGTAVPVASLALDGGPTYGFGTLANGSNADHVFTLTNSGGIQATSIGGVALSAPFSFKGGTFPGSGGTCSGSLNAAQSCTVVVNFAPTATGLQTATVTINYNDGTAAQTATRAMQGTGAPPASLAFDGGTTFDFGTRATGSVNEQTFTLTNSGGFTASSLSSSGLSAPFTFKGGTYPGAGGTCNTTLAAATSCTVVVRYAPTATGSLAQTLTLAYDDGATARTATQAMQGIGAAPASLAISDATTYDFGNVATGGNRDKTFTITNSGGVPATALAGSGLAAPYTFKGGTFPGAGGSCTATLGAGGATCTVVVSFAPTATGVASATFTLAYNDGVGAQTATRPVTGTGVAPATLLITDGPTYDFGPVVQTASLDKTFTVTNSGDLAATSVVGSGLSAPFTFKGGSYPGSGGTCGGTINSGASCTLVVTFNPTATGPFASTIQLDFNDGAQARTSTRAVQGTGATPASLVISNGPTYDFGTVARNSSSDVTLTVTNGGGVGASSIAGASLTAPYSFKGGVFPGTGGTCTTTLAAAGTCTLVINYNPTTVATHNATVTLNYQNGLTSVSSSRAVTGQAVPPAVLTFADAPSYDFGTLATGGFAERAFTVTNTGSFTASSIAGTGPSAPFTFKGGAFPGSGGSCTTTLNAGSSCTVVLRYAPTATGTQTATVNLGYNDGSAAQTGSLALQGTGAAPATLSISDGATYGFGTLANGSTASKSFVITNSGGVPATALAGSGLSAPYGFLSGTYPGTGGTCTTTLAASATCTVVVQFAPIVSGTANATFAIGYNDGVTTQSTTRALTGTSVPPATITISDATTYNFGTLANGATAEHAFTLTNGGQFTATTMAGSGLTTPYAFKGGSYPGSGGTCSVTLAPAATCTVVVTFAPSASGTYNQSLSIAFNDGVTNQSSTRAVTGIGAPPAALAWSDGATFDFGLKATGSSTDKTFTITNSGGVDATSIVASGLGAPYTFKGGPYPGAGGTCGTTIASAASCTVVVNFAPTGTGTQTATGTLAYNDGVTAAATATRPMTAVGAAPATITISDATTYDYGSIATGGALDHTFTIGNTGGVPATGLGGSGLSAPFTFKGASYPGTGGTCTTTLNAGDTCTVVVTFAPTVAGAQNATMSLGYNNGVSAQSSTRALTGTGVAPAALTISDGPTYDFGPVVATGSQDRTFTVNNSGSLAATTVTPSGLSAPFTFKGGAYPGSGGTCGTTINAGATCSVVVTFTPAATGPFNATMNLAYNDGAQNQNAQRPVQGTGATPASLTISNGSTYSFGTVAQGSTNDFTFTVTNGGGVGATSLAGAALAAPYSFKGGSYPGGGTCGTTLAAAASCTIIINYNPTTIATHTATVTLNYQDGLNAASATRPVTGTAVAPASLTISDGSTYDYGTLATGATLDKTFTVTNGGSFGASSLGAGTGLAAPFTYKGGSFPGTGGSCTTTLNAGVSCTIVVTYAPVATGLQASTIRVVYYDGAQNQNVTRAVQGTGAAPALLAISEAEPYDFGSQANGSTTDKSFVVSNSGGVNATAMSGGGLSAPFAFKGGTYPGTGGTCSATLAPAQTCTVVVTYAPTGTGTTNGTLTVSYNDGVTTQSSGRGVRGASSPPAQITISDGPTYNFGNVANGSTNERTFTLTNGGSFAATGMTGTAPTAPYSFKGGSYPGNGGNCSTTLVAGNSCTVVVVFAPTVTGTYNQTLSVAYNDGVTAQSATRAVTGVSAPPASLAIDGGPTYAFGTQATGSTTERTFTVTNSGGVNALTVVPSGLSAPFTFKGGSFPGLGGTCTATIASSGSCTLVVNYAPTATGTQNATLTLTYNDGVTTSQTTTRPMTGTGAAPAAITISDGTTYNFGSIAAGGSTDHTFTLNNTGGVSATALAGSGLSAPFTFKGASFPGTGGSCTTTLNAGQSCTVVVTYAPTVAGTNNATMSIGFDDGVATQSSTRAMTGTAVAPASLTISDATTYDYGAVVATASLDHVFTVTNGGSLQATSIVPTALGAPFTFKGGSFPGIGGNCGTTLNASTSCTIAVTFNPSTTGSFSDTLRLAYYDGAQNQNVTRPIQGQGATAASITISGASPYSFGTVANGASIDATLTLTNGGGVAATSLGGSGLSAPYTFKGGAFPGGGTCGTTLAAAATCTVVINYNPATVATHNGTMQIDYANGLTTTSSTRGVTGQAVAPAAITISDASTYDFGTLATGATLDHTFTITNGGTFAASSLGGATLSTPFSYKNGTFPGTGGTCSTTLNGGGTTCTVVVTYAPSATGTQTSTLTINYNDGVQAKTSGRAIQGTGASPALLTISDSGFNFGLLANGSSVDKTFTVTNSGGVPATGLSGSGLSAPITFKGGTYAGSGASCTTTLAAGASCTVVVAFNPTTTGTYNATMAIAYNDGAQAQSATRAMSGSSTTPASLTISDATTYDFGPVATGGGASHAFTITNGGGFTALSLNPGSFSAPFGYAGGPYPGSAGTCGASLAGGQSCTIVVAFAPGSLGSQTATLTLGYNDGANAQSASRGMQGVGATPASLSISDGTTYSFGTVAQGSSNDKTFTITNNGASPASSIAGSGLSAPYGFKGGPFPGSTGTCTATLAPAASCTVVVNYSPASVATANATLSIAYNDGVNSQSTTRAMTGTAVAPASLTFSDASPYDFGTIATGATKDKTFTITNGGSYGASALAAATVTAPFAYVGGNYPGSGGNCNTDLAAGASCTIVVRFAPGTTGSASNALTLNYNNGANVTASTITLQGVAAGPAVLTVSDGPTYAFGTVATTASVTKTFTINNSGGVAATSLAGSGLAAPITFLNATFPGTGGTCTTTLNAGQSCTVVVRFAPTSATAYNATMAIGYNDGVSAQSATRAITGSGAAPALITVSGGSSYDYGAVPATGASDHTFTFTNSGGVSASSLVINGLSGAFNYKGTFFPGNGGTCTGTLTAGNSCTVVVTFSPSTNTSYGGSLNYSYNDGNATQSGSVTLAGTGATAALLAWSGGAYSYGSVTNGNNAEHTFTLANTGGVSATGLSLSGVSAPYSYKGGPYPGTGGNCGTTIAANSSCTVVVVYSPTSVGTQSTTLSMGYNDGLAAQTTTVGVSGTSISAAALTISDGPTYNFNSIYYGQQDDKTFTITNNGATTATTLAGTVVTVPFAYKNNTYPGTLGTCGTTLAGSGASCTIVVTFAPTSANTFTGQINETYYDGAQNQTATRAIAGAANTPIMPAAPGAPTMTINAASSINLSWTGSATGTGPITYNVQRTQTSGSGYATIASGLSSNTYTDGTGTAGTTYYYRITATGLAGTTNGAESGAIKPLGAFTLSSSTPGDRSVTLAWAASAGANSYTVTYGSTSGSYPNTASVTATSPYAVTGLTPGQTYYFMVSAVATGYGSINAGGEITGVPIAVPVSFAKGGQSDTACAILSNKSLKCWGRGLYNMLGNGSIAQYGDSAEQVGGTLPVSVGTSRTITKLFLGSMSNHACAILDNGTAKCWGRNNVGQLGLGDTASRGDDPTRAGDNLLAINFGSGRTPVKMALGQSHSCAILDNGRVKCFGQSNYGQLGYGDNVTRGNIPNQMGDNLGYVNLGTGRTAVDISAGTDSTCALLDNGTVKCWGRNNVGQLGIDSNVSPIGTSGTQMGDNLLTANIGTTATQVAVGNQFACALLTGGNVKCWGNNGNGQLGQDNTSTYSASTTTNTLAAMNPVNLGSGRTATQISVGQYNVCAYLDNGTTKCWGAGNNGTLGQGNTINYGNSTATTGGDRTIANLPVMNTGTIYPVTGVAAGNLFGCVTQGTTPPYRAKCFGTNSTGVLGIGDNGSVTTSTANIGDAVGEIGDSMPFLDIGGSITQVIAGSANVCALRDDGKAFCFGDNTYGRLGAGRAANLGDLPDQMGSKLAAVNLGTGMLVSKAATGQNHVCAMFTTGQVKCWGRNNYGQLGLGDNNSRDTLSDMGDNLPFVNLGTNKTAKDIAAGNSHTCAILNDNTVKCWGRNNNGQLGLDSTINKGAGSTDMASLSTVDLGSGRTATQIVAGGSHTCAILDTGNVKCWGYNGYGQLGQGNTNNYGSATNTTGGNQTIVNSVIVPLGTSRTATQLTAGDNHTCAILDNNTVKCWGRSNNGQLGYDATTSVGATSGQMGDSLNPVNIGASLTATSIVATTNHTCVTRSNGTAICWGAGGNGRLGQGTTANWGTGGNLMTNLPAISVPAGVTFTAIYALNAETCMIGSDQIARCFGQALYGALGQEQSTADTTSTSLMGGNLLATPLF